MSLRSPAGSVGTCSGFLPKTSHMRLKADFTSAPYGCGGSCASSREMTSAKVFGGSDGSSRSKERTQPRRDEAFDERPEPKPVRDAEAMPISGVLLSQPI